MEGTKGSNLDNLFMRDIHSILTYSNQHMLHTLAINNIRFLLFTILRKPQKENK